MWHVISVFSDRFLWNIFLLDISQPNSLIGWLRIQALARILMSRNLEIVANISPLTSVLTGILVLMTYGDHLGKVLVWLAPLFIRNNHIQIAAIDDCKSAARTSILLHNLCGDVVCSPCSPGYFAFDKSSNLIMKETSHCYSILRRASHYRVWYGH